MAKSAAENPETATQQAQTPRPEGNRQLPIRWDDSNLKSSYANVANVSSTRSEIVLVFGINQAWERGQSELKIELSNRIILSPFAAKQLSELLGRVMTEYETRFGTLTPEPRQ